MEYKTIAHLVARAKQGEEEAFVALYSEFAKPLYFTALRMTKNEHDAQDMVQETMLELYKNLPEIKDAQYFTAYLFKIIYYRCSTLLKKKKPVLMEETGQLIEETADTDAEFIPASYAEKMEMREYVISLVNQLEESQRSIILQYYYQQFSGAQIAETMGITIDAVKMRLSRARVALKKKIARGIAGNSMKVMVMGMSTPILTKIFEIEAEAAFTAEVNERIYTGIAAKLNLATPFSQVAAVTAAARSGGTAAVTVFKHLLVLVLVAGIVSGGEVYSQQYQPTLAVSPGVPYAGVSIAFPPSGERVSPQHQLSEAAEGHSTPSAGQPQRHPSSQTAMAVTPSEIAGKEEASPLLQPLVSEYEADPKAPPVSPTQAADMPDKAEESANDGQETDTPAIPADMLPPEFPPEASPPSETEAPAHSETPGIAEPTFPGTALPGATFPPTPVQPPNTSPDAAPKPGVKGVKLEAENQRIHYPIGHPVTEEAFLADVNVKIVGEADGMYAIKVDFYEQVNFNATGDYAVLIGLVTDGTRRSQVAVVITIN